MALAPFLVLTLLIIASIIAGVFLIGLILLIIGASIKGKKKYEGKKSPIVMMVVGVCIMLPAAILFAVVAAHALKDDFTRAKWERDGGSVVELWQETHVTDEVAAPQALKALLFAADKGDKDAFVINFAKNVREDPEFDKMVDQFFKEYKEFPVKLDELEFDGGVAGGNATHDRGVTTRWSSAYYNINLGDDSYYIGMRFCFENDKDPDEIGVTWFEVTNLGGYVDYNLTMDGREIEHDDAVACYYCTPDEVSARRIAGHAMRWTESSVGPGSDLGMRLLSVDEMKDLLNSVKTLDEAIATGSIGQPNSEYHMSASTSVYYYYEIESESEGETGAGLVPETDKRRYVKICVSRDGEIIDAWVCSEDRGSIIKIAGD